MHSCLQRSWRSSPESSIMHCVKKNANVLRICTRIKETAVRRSPSDPYAHLPLCSPEMHISALTLPIHYYLLIWCHLLLSLCEAAEALWVKRTVLVLQCLRFCCMDWVWINLNQLHVSSQKKNKVKATGASCHLDKPITSSTSPR